MKPNSTTSSALCQQWLIMITRRRRFKDGLEQQYRVVLSAIGSSSFASLVENAKKIEFELQNSSPPPMISCPPGGPSNFSTAGANQKQDYGDSGKSNRRPMKKFKNVQSTPTLKAEVAEGLILCWPTRASSSKAWSRDDVLQVW